MAAHASVKDKKQIMFCGKKSHKKELEPGVWDFKLNPKDYRTFPNPLTYNRHHILPYTSVAETILQTAADSSKGDNFLSALFFFTNWNNNETHNLVGLPGTKSYANLYGKRGGKQGVTKVLDAVNSLPCHQPTSWGHTVYNDKVAADLKKLWADVQIKIVKEHGVDKLESGDVGGDLTGIETKWRKQCEVGTPRRSPNQENWRKTWTGEDDAYNHFTMVKLPESPV